MTETPSAESASTGTPSTGLLCSDADLGAGDDLRGSAAEFDAFVLVEHSTSFGETAADDAIQAAYPADAAAVLDIHGLRSFAVRAVGRTARSGSAVRYLGRTGPSAGLFACDEQPSASRLTLLAAGDPTAAGASINVPSAGNRPGAGTAGAGAPGEKRRYSPLFAVCTNGARDRCCALKGRDLAAELHHVLDGAQPGPGVGGPNQMDPDDDSAVVEISHLGGHRFAPTMLVLPWGYAYGRLDVDTALEICFAAQDGLVHPAGLRGRADLPPAAQVADAIWRAELGPSPVGAVDVRQWTTEGDVAVVHATVAGRSEQLRLRRDNGRMLADTACGGKPIQTARWRLLKA